MDSCALQEFVAARTKFDVEATAQLALVEQARASKSRHEEQLQQLQQQRREMEAQYAEVKDQVVVLERERQAIAAKHSAVKASQSQAEAAASELQRQRAVVDERAQVNRGCCLYSCI
jgi:chromosome segregation ATPase